MMMKWAAGLCLLAGSVCAGLSLEQSANITQDRLAFDLNAEAVWFNDQAIRITQLAERLKDSYSIDLNVIYDRGDEEGVDDLFGEPKKEKVPEAPIRFSPGSLRRILGRLDAAAIPPERVRVNIYVKPTIRRNAYHHLELGGSGEVFLDGREIALADIKGMNPSGAPYLVSSLLKVQHVDYRQLLRILEAVGDDAEIAGLSFVTSGSVQVEAQIIRILDDGREDVLSAPRLTTQAGNEAMVRVVENASGYKLHQLADDNFHQEDLAHLGIRFSATPQIIGDYLKVEGVAIITRLKSRHPVFVDKKIPVASYACSKVVVPFSVVFEEGTDSVEFDIADIEGNAAKCRLSAKRVDQRGMTREERETAQKAAKIHP